MEPLEQQGARPGGRPRPAWDLLAGHTGQPGLGAGLGRPPPRAARPAARPRPASQVRRLLIFCLRTFDTENAITSTYELRFR